MFKKMIRHCEGACSLRPKQSRKKPYLLDCFAVLAMTISVLLTPIAHSTEFKDPTEPPDVDLHTSKSTSSDVLRRLNVYEIISNGQDRWAVINNTIVREGDLILGERVIKISKEQVTLRGETGEIHLHLINGKPIKEVSQ